MKILILDNYDSFTYNLAQLVEENIEGAFSLDIIYNDQINLSAVAEYDKILLSPGAGVPSEAGLMPALIQQYAATKSILGVCLGHQALAEAFGASLINLPVLYHGLSHRVDILVEDMLFRGLPDFVEVGLYHSWAVQTSSLPDCLELTALSQDKVVMAIRHKVFDVRGIQFHPESVMTPQGAMMLKNWLLG